MIFCREITKSQILNPTHYLFYNNPGHNISDLVERHETKLNSKRSIKESKIWFFLQATKQKKFKGSDFSNLVPAVAVIVSISADHWSCLSWALWQLFHHQSHNLDYKSWLNQQNYIERILFSSLGIIILSFLLLSKSNLMRLQKLFQIRNLVI